MLEYQIRTTRGTAVAPNPTPMMAAWCRSDARRAALAGVAPRPGPVPDLAKFERAETGDDYCHRMT
jgi:hypothetical protein